MMLMVMMQIVRYLGLVGYGLEVMECCWDFEFSRWVVIGGCVGLGRSVYHCCWEALQRFEGE